MLNERLAAARTVRDEFLAAEAAQDEAAIRAVRAVGAMLEARRDAKVPIATGLQEIAQAARAAALSIQARHVLAESHAGLAKVPAAIGLGAWFYGDDGHCPDPEAPHGEGRTGLRAVA